jgi:hypothetical protein
LFAFVNREIKRSLQQSVFPRGVDVEFVSELAFFGHEIGDDGYGHNENEAFV